MTHQQTPTSQKTPALLSVKKAATNTSPASKFDDYSTPSLRPASSSTRNQKDLVKILSPLSVRTKTPTKKSAQNLSVLNNERTNSRERDSSVKDRKKKKKNQLSIAIPSEEKSFDSVSFARVVTKPTTPTRRPTTTTNRTNKKIVPLREKVSANRASTPSKSNSEEQQQQQIVSSALPKRANITKPNSRSVKSALGERASSDKVALKLASEKTTKNSSIDVFTEKRRIIVDMLSVKLFYSSERVSFEENFLDMVSSIYPMLQLWDDISKYVISCSSDWLIISEVEQFFVICDHWKRDLHRYIYEEGSMEGRDPPLKDFKFQSNIAFLRPSVLNLIEEKTRKFGKACSSENISLAENDPHSDFDSLVTKAMLQLGDDSADSSVVKLIGGSNGSKNHHHQSSRRQIFESEQPETNTILEEEDYDEEEDCEDDSKSVSREHSDKKQVFIDLLLFKVTNTEKELVQKARTVLLEIPVACSRARFKVDLSVRVQKEVLAACLLVFLNLQEGTFAANRENYENLFKLFDTIAEEKQKIVTLSYSNSCKKFKFIRCQ